MRGAPRPHGPLTGRNGPARSGPAAPPAAADPPHDRPVPAPSPSRPTTSAARGLLPRRPGPPPGGSRGNRGRGAGHKTPGPSSPPRPHLPRVWAALLHVGLGLGTGPSRRRSARHIRGPAGGSGGAPATASRKGRAPRARNCALAPGVTSAERKTWRRRRELDRHGEGAGRWAGGGAGAGFVESGGCPGGAARTRARVCARSSRRSVYCAPAAGLRRRSRKPAGPPIPGGAGSAVGGARGGQAAWPSGMKGQPEGGVRRRRRKGAGAEEVIPQNQTNRAGRRGVHW